MSTTAASTLVAVVDVLVPVESVLVAVVDVDATDPDGDEVASRSQIPKPMQRINPITSATANRDSGL
jgi:hypothetical protein